MLVFYFITFSIAAYSLCVFGDNIDNISEECLEQERAECDNNKMPKVFPTSVDELRGICRDVKEYGDCILGVRDICLDNVNKTRGFRKFVTYVHKVCEENYGIFQVISSNIACLAPLSENLQQKCREFPFSDPVKELMMNLMRQVHENSQFERTGEESSCLETLWNIYCPSIKASVVCGTEVGVAVKDVLINTEYHNLCRDDFVAEVTPMLEAIESAVIQEERLKKMLLKEQESPSEAARRKRRFASTFQPFINFF